MTGTGALLAAICLAVKTTADQVLGVHAANFGPLELRLSFNPGVAFSLGDHLPSAVLIALTGLITLGVLAYAWRSAATLSRPELAGFAAVLGGAVANLADRAPDGLVTDYFHTGWFPTFNLPDVLITTGAALILLGMLRRANTVNNTADNTETAAERDAGTPC